MLSIALLGSSAQALSYFELDDYYTKGTLNPEAQGVWHGKGAAALGLSGSVRPEDFKAILDGVLPNGQVLGTDDEDERRHTPGWDLTFSAPKSVSVLAELGADGRLLEAHDRAVDEALAWVGAHSLGTRVRSPLGRLFLGTDSLVAARFTHHTSRNQDPDTHTHVVVMNAVEREDGQWASVHSHVLFKHKMAIGAIYRAALARELQELGYNVEVTHRDGRFEIAGLPPEVLEFFSSRRAEIKEQQNKWGSHDAKSAATAAKITRRRKEHVERDILVGRWRTAAEDLGFNVDQRVAELLADGPHLPVEGVDLATALKDAMDRLSERQAVFSHADIVRDALSGAMGRTDVAAVEAAILTLEYSGRLARVDEAGYEQWTTPRARFQERRIFEKILKGKGTREPITTRDDIAAELAALPMNDEQRASAERILTTDDLFTFTVGLPGVGKTSYMLKYVRQLAEARGKQLVGMAQNRDAANNLEEDTGMPSSTIHGHLMRVGRDLAAIRRYDPRVAAAIRAKYGKQVWVVDEGSLLSNSLKTRLVNAAVKLSVPVVFVGDPKQMGPIDAGDPFRVALKRGASVTEIKEIQRQKNSPRAKEYIGAIHDVRGGKVKEALEKLREVTEEIPEAKKRLKEMLWLYREMGDRRAETLLLTARHDEKFVLNDGVRQILMEEGKLQDDTPREKLVSVISNKADLRDARFFQVGHIVRFGDDVPDIGARAGEYRRVESVDPKTNTVTLEAPGKAAGGGVRWNPRKSGTSGRYPAEVYKPIASALARGDLVRWSKNVTVNEKKFYNGQMLRVSRVEGQSTTFTTRGGEEVTIDHNAPEAAHWDHAYASTVYSSQGRTVRTVLTNAESDRGELLSQRAFLVAISRHRESLILFTDNRKELESALLRHLGEKSSATEATERTQALAAAGISGRITRDWDRSAGGRSATESPQVPTP
jgi:conjugative relaxase-like TrwC/TraI family protein